MNVTENATKFPLQVTFRDVEAFPSAEQWIRSEAAKLTTFYERIMSCRVAIESPHHHREGNQYHVRIDLTLPGGELVIKHEPPVKTRAREAGEAAIKKHLDVRDPHKHLRQAITDAFAAAGRRLQDYARRQRGDVKHREPRFQAKVAQLFGDKGYGFLLTPEGREIYFHKESVLGQSFDRLQLGTAVSFAEESGDKGPQASSVRILAKQGSRPVEHHTKA
ncbi:MAG TPA: HPF/RaiA family ribosome-associated protein [Acidobacteriaceae bacterium]|nr:HPF/RaiA family ribosome-associated protein [Acidobacteriaceae bacterium]